MSKLTFHLVSPEQHVLTREVDMAVIPGQSGDLGILDRHSALISSLRPGLITLHQENTSPEYIFVSGGFLNVNEEGCTVLAEEYLFAREIDRQDLETFVEKTREELTRARDQEEKERLKKDLELANIKMSIVRHLPPHTQS